MTEPTAAPTPARRDGRALLGALGGFTFYIYGALVVAGVAISEQLIDARSDGAEIAGLPIVVLGLGFYLAAFVLLFVWRFVADLRAALASVFLLGGLLGVACSLVLAAVSALDVDPLCPACVGLHAVNAGLLLTAALTHPAGWRAAILGLPAALTRQAAGLAAIVLLVMTLAAYGIYTDRVDDAARDEKPPTVEPAVAVNVGDAPGRGPADAALVIVEFSDLQCPDCKQFAESLATVSETLPARHHFKHYPLDATCNRAVRETTHPDACLAATAMVCVRALGGDARAWEMHDLMFQNQSRLDRRSLIDLAGRIGLGSQSFGECLGDRIALAVVRADIEQAIDLGVEGAPTWFVNGHRVTSALRVEVVQAIVERFLRVRMGRAADGRRR